MSMDSSFVPEEAAWNCSPTSRQDEPEAAVKQVGGDGAGRVPRRRDHSPRLDEAQRSVARPGRGRQPSPTWQDRGPDGGVRIGAMVRNSDLAHDETIRKRYPVLSEALLSGATPQIRNMATSAATSCSGPGAIPLLRKNRLFFNATFGLRWLGSPCHNQPNCYICR